MKLIKLGLKKFTPTGNLLFALGLVIAIIAGFLHAQLIAFSGSIILLLIILGTVFAVLHLETTDVTKMLISLIGLLVLAVLFPFSGAVGGTAIATNASAGIGGTVADALPGVPIRGIVYYIAILASPATLILILKNFVDQIIK